MGNTWRTIADPASITIPNVAVGIVVSLIAVSIGILIVPRVIEALITHLLLISDMINVYKLNFRVNEHHENIGAT